MSLARVLALSSKRGGSSILARAATFVAPRSIGEPPLPSSPLVDRVPSAGPHGPATCCGALREIQTPVSEQSCDSSLWHLPARVSAHICENTICILFSGRGPDAGRDTRDGLSRKRICRPARGEDDSRGSSSRQSTNERRYSVDTARTAFYGKPSRARTHTPAAPYMYATARGTRDAAPAWAPHGE